MSIGDFDLAYDTLDCAFPVRAARVDAGEWRTLCLHVAAGGGRLVALWGSDRRQGGAAYETAYAMHAALASDTEFAVVTLSLAGTAYPDISDLFPAAIRMQRAVRDLLGLSATGAADARKWLRHVAWPAAVFPLRKSAFEGDTQVFDFKGKKKMTRTRSTPTRSCKWRATGCMKLRSARCMPAPSSPDISAFPSSANACCVSSNGSATNTRALKNVLSK